MDSLGEFGNDAMNAEKAPGRTRDDGQRIGFPQKGMNEQRTFKTHKQSADKSMYQEIPRFAFV